ncbi:glycosyltransferase family 4 protein [Bacillus thuringiensis]|uniref:glycosyltransferase family 4 protein n=1 Tax=Bacillus thuringiensis TaxID=1428 RepID=UPI001399010D|nr:glycosyltransferase family 4 protein [Bacillus thuringiensis]BCA34280.1 hypothetical protein BwiPL1_26620 [Bacillus wiedmannii]
MKLGRTFSNLVCITDNRKGEYMNYIVFPGELDLRRGGPSGYIANLNEGLKTIGGNQEVNLIVNENVLTAVESKNKISKLKSILGKSNFITERIMEKKSIDLRDITIRSKLQNTNFSHSDVIHLHNVMDYNKIKEYNFSSKLVLTPHTPESVADEFVDVVRNTFKNQNLKLKRYKNKIKEVEDRAFKECEYFIFPSKESMEIYTTFVDGFEEIIKDKKVYFNMTGSKPLSYKMNQKEFREKYGIAQDAFVISYIGRHNSIKGFDILKEAAKAIHEIDPNIIFVSGGTGDIKAESDNFIQIGWTDDPGSIVNASDLFVLPNRNTYFDLVLLEVLSLGTPVLASNTGGNKTVAHLTKGVKLFENEDIEELVSNILNFKKSQDVLLEMEKENIKCFNENFTLEKFAERYINILGQINKP